MPKLKHFSFPYHKLLQTKKKTAYKNVSFSLEIKVFPCSSSKIVQVSSLAAKYNFSFTLGDQDWFTLLGFEVSKINSIHKSVLHSLLNFKCMNYIIWQDWGHKVFPDYLCKVKQSIQVQPSIVLLVIFETHGELVNHNDKYYYSHRITLNKDYEKHILDEFQRLDEDGFFIHRKFRLVNFSFP